MKRTANVAQHCLQGHNRTHKITYEVQTTFALTEDFYFGLWTLFGSEDILMGLRYRGIYFVYKGATSARMYVLALNLTGFGIAKDGWAAAERRTAAVITAAATAAAQAAPPNSDHHLNLFRGTH